MSMSMSPMPPQTLPLSLADQRYEKSWGKRRRSDAQQDNGQLGRLTCPPAAPLTAGFSSTSSEHTSSTTTTITTTASSSPSDEASSSSSLSSQTDSTHFLPKTAPPAQIPLHQHPDFYYSHAHGQPPLRPFQQMQQLQRSPYSSRPHSLNLVRPQQAVLRDSTSISDRPAVSSHGLPTHKSKAASSQAPKYWQASSPVPFADCPHAAVMPPGSRNARLSHSSRRDGDRSSTGSVPFVIPPPQQQPQQQQAARLSQHSQRPYSVASSARSSPYSPVVPRFSGDGRGDGCLGNGHEPPQRRSISSSRHSSLVCASPKPPQATFYAHHSSLPRNSVGGHSKSSSTGAAEIIHTTYAYRSDKHHNYDDELSTRTRHNLRAILHLSTLATPLSLIIAVYALVAAILITITMPLRVCFSSSLRPFPARLHHYLASALHFHIWCLLGPEYVDYQGFTADSEPSSGSSLLLTHLIAPLLALPLAAAAWVAVFMWGLSAMVVDDAVAGASGAGTAQERRWAARVIGMWLAWLERGRRSASSSSSAAASSSLPARSTNNNSSAATGDHRLSRRQHNNQSSKRSGDAVCEMAFTPVSTSAASTSAAAAATHGDDKQPQPPPPQRRLDEEAAGTSAV